MESIVTPRLRIRPFTADDIDNLIALHSDREVMRYITDGQPDDPARLRNEVLPRWLKLYESLDGWGFFAADEVSTGQFVGWFHLLPTQTEGEWDIGYRLHRAFWGKGLATEGAGALLAKLAWTNRATRVIARCMSANKASARVMEKLGLAYEGEFQETRFPGECQCATRYSMDWSTIVHRRVWLARAGLNDRVIRRLPSGWLAMFDYQTMPGYTVLLSDPVYRDLNAAPGDYRQAFLRDMGCVGDALLQAMNCELINYMVLGNTDRALHAHITPRFADEPADKRKTGPWAYYPTAQPQQRMFDAQRDRELMDRIGAAIDRVTGSGPARRLDEA